MNPVNKHKAAIYYRSDRSIRAANKALRVLREIRAAAADDAEQDFAPRAAEKIAEELQESLVWAHQLLDALRASQQDRLSEKD